MSFQVIHALKRHVDLLSRQVTHVVQTVLFPGSQELALAYEGHSPNPQEQIKGYEREGFLWAVPKKRRSLEKRTIRKYGLKEWHWKLYVPKTNIRICETCGHHHEAKHLCPKCYERIMLETKNIREKAENYYQHSPEDKEVVVLYESEREQLNERKELDTFTEGKVVVDMPAARPSWFPNNLLQKSTAGRNTKSKQIIKLPEKPTVHS